MSARRVRGGRASYQTCMTCLRDPDTVEDAPVLADVARIGYNMCLAGQCAFRYACVDCVAATMGTGEREADVRRICRFDPTGNVRSVDATWEYSGFVYRLSAEGLQQADQCPPR